MFDEDLGTSYHTSKGSQSTRPPVRNLYVYIRIQIDLSVYLYLLLNEGLLLNLFYLFKIFLFFIEHCGKKCLLLTTITPYIH